MNTLDIPDAGITVRVPASYAEMTRPQLLYTMRLLHGLQQGRISFAEFQARILYKLANIKRTARSIVWERLHPDATHAVAEKVALLADRLLGFLFTDNGNTRLPAFDLLENPLPVLRIGPIRLVGPADGLLDLSFEELIAADAELALYRNARRTTHRHDDCHTIPPSWPDTTERAQSATIPAGENRPHHPARPIHSSVEKTAYPPLVHGLHRQPATRHIHRLRPRGFVRAAFQQQRIVRQIARLARHPVRPRGKTNVRRHGENRKDECNRHPDAIAQLQIHFRQC